MKAAHSRTGVFSRIGEILYRYTSSGVYYARYRNKCKPIHHSLNTTDREFAKRLLKKEISKVNKVDPSPGKMTLEELLKQDDESLKQYAAKTAVTRRSILKIFKETRELGLDLPLKSISAWRGFRDQSHGSSAGHQAAADGISPAKM